MQKSKIKNIPKSKQKGKIETKNNSQLQQYIAVGLSILITYICFANALKNEFTNWDDPGYVLDNELVKSLSFNNIKNIFSTYVMGNYHPFAVLSLAIDFHFNQITPHGFHATSIILHLLNVGAVFLFVRMLSGQILIAFIASLLFGIHPMHVESVSWISERKDLLYLFFYITSLCLYLLHLKSEKRKTIFFALTLVAFLFSLLSKAQAVTLPIILLLIDYFLNRSFDKKTFLEKIPFFALSIIFGVIAVIAQKQSGAITDIPNHSFFERILFASYSFLTYIVKLFLPLHLSAYYPYPVSVSGSYPVLYYIAPILVLGFIGLLVWLFNKNRAVVFGLAFYLVNIFLLLQLLPVGGSMMSERYTYLCYVGLCFIIGYLFYIVWNSNSNSISKFKYPFAAALLVYTFFIGSQTIERNKIWNNSEVLWTDVIKQYPQVVIAHNNRGSFYQKKEKIDLALIDFNEALRLKPDYPEALINRSDVYRVYGKNDLAIEDCNKAIAVDKNYVGAYMNRGIALCIVGKFDDAFKDFNTVIAKDAKNANVYCNRGNLFDMRGLLDSAISDYTHAIAINANYPDAYYNRAKTYLRKGNYDQAIADFTIAINQNTKNPDVFYFRSQTFKEKKMFKEALDDLLTAQKMGKVIDQNYLNELKKNS